MSTPNASVVSASQSVAVASMSISEAAAQLHLCEIYLAGMDGEDAAQMELWIAELEAQIAAEEARLSALPIDETLTF